MEISEHTVLKLVEGQATIAQEVKDIGRRLDTAIPYLITQDKQNADNIIAVEKKVWYFGGAGSVIGFFVSHFGGKFITLFGGK